MCVFLKSLRAASGLHRFEKKTVYIWRKITKTPQKQHFVLYEFLIGMKFLSEKFVSGILRIRKLKMLRTCR